MEWKQKQPLATAAAVCVYSDLSPKKLPKRQEDTAKRGHNHG